MLGVQLRNLKTVNTVKFKSSEQKPSFEQKLKDFTYEASAQRATHIQEQKDLCDRHRNEYNELLNKAYKLLKEARIQEKVEDFKEKTNGLLNFDYWNIEKVD